MKAIPVTIVAALPVLERVTVFVGAAVPIVVLANVRDVGFRVAVGVPPVPVRLASGEPKALLAIEIAALRVPRTLGVNTTLTVQVPFGAIGEAATQVLVPGVKSPASLPVIEKPVTLSAALPVLVIVIGTGAEAVVSGSAVKTRGFGLNETSGTAALLARAATLRTRLFFESLMRRSEVVFGRGVR